MFGVRRLIAFIKMLASIDSCYIIGCLSCGSGRVCWRNKGDESGSGRYRWCENSHRSREIVLSWPMFVIHSL